MLLPLAECHKQQARSLRPMSFWDLGFKLVACWICAAWIIVLPRPGCAHHVPMGNQRGCSSTQTLFRGLAAGHSQKGQEHVFLYLYTLKESQTWECAHSAMCLLLIQKETFTGFPSFWHVKVVESWGWDIILSSIFWLTKSGAYDAWQGKGLGVGLVVGHKFGRCF